MNVDRYGNTSSASIPIALDEAIESRRVERGLDRAARRVRRRLHVGVDGRPLLSAWTSCCFSPGRARRSPGWERTSPRRFPRRARRLRRGRRRARHAAEPPVLRGAGRRAHAHAQRAAGAARARRRRVGASTRDALGPHVVAAAGHSLGEFTAYHAAELARPRRRGARSCAGAAS